MKSLSNVEGWKTLVIIYARSFLVSGQGNQYNQSK